MLNILIAVLIVFSVSLGVVTFITLLILRLNKRRRELENRFYLPSDEYSNLIKNEK